MKPLRIATFNVLYRSPYESAPKWLQRRELIRRAIDEARPDVIGLQEVLPETIGDLPYVLGSLAFITGPDRGPARFSLWPWLDVLLRLLRSEGLHQPARGTEKQSSQELQPIAYRPDRLRAHDSGAFWISSTPDAPGSMLPMALGPFLVHWARFEDLEEGGTLLVLNTHLGHMPWHHTAEARVIRERVAALARKDEPVFLVGDFNAVPSSHLVSLLDASGLVDTARTAARRSGPRATFHWGIGADWVGTTLDYVLGRTTRHVASVTRVRSSEGRLHASDHHLLVVELR